MLHPSYGEAAQSIRIIIDSVAKGERNLAIYRDVDSLHLIRHDFYAPDHLSSDELDRRLQSLKESFGSQVERIDVTPEMAATIGSDIFLDPVRV